MLLKASKIIQKFHYAVLYMGNMKSAGWWLVGWQYVETTTAATAEITQAASGVCDSDGSTSRE